MFSPPNYSDIRNFLDPRMGPWTVVLYMHRKRILKSLMANVPVLKGRLLDIGCGNKPYETILQCSEYIGVDVETSPHTHSKVDVFFDGIHLPFETSTFDSVICTEVIEHCSDANKLIAEVSRVLKPGGHAFITAPMFIEHHEVPFDLRRLTYYGMKSLAESSGLEVAKIEDRGRILSVFVNTYYLVVSQFVSRRPISDVIYWLLFPFSCLFLLADGIKKKIPPPISLGWQMLARKGTHKN